MARSVIDYLLDSDEEIPPAELYLASSLPAVAAPLPQLPPPLVPMPVLSGLPNPRPVGADVGTGGGVGSVGGASSASTGAAASSGTAMVGNLAAGAVPSSGAEVINLDEEDADGSGSDIATALPLPFWCLRIGRRMVEADAFVRSSGNRVRWHLPAPGSDIVPWAIAHVNNILSQEYVRAFYIGLTALLPERCWDSGRGHFVKGWQVMFIVGVSDDADEIGNGEKAVIAQFRRHDPRGLLVNHNGHPLCTNRNPGGEGARAGIPPHFLYLCFSWNPRGR